MCISSSKLGILLYQSLQQEMSTLFSFKATEE